MAGLRVRSPQVQQQRFLGAGSLRSGRALGNHAVRAQDFRACDRDEHKKAFGLDAVETDPPESFEVVQVGPSVPLADIARSAGITEGELAGLNPAFLAGRTPPAVTGLQ